MKLQQKILCLLLPLLFLSSCSNNSSSPPETLPVEIVEDNTALLEQIDAIYKKMDKAIIPLQSIDKYIALDSFDGIQLLKDDETAKKLAKAVYNLLDAYGNGLGNYTNPEELSSAKTTTALWHTAPIDFSWEITRDGDFNCSNPDHVLAALVRRELDSGRTPVALYYAEDVRKIAEKLFGTSARVTDMDAPPYYYYKKEGVFILMDEISKPQIIPQIVNYEKTSTGYITDVILTDQLQLTKEKALAIAADEQHLKYTFKEQNGNLILEKLERGRPN